MRRKGSGIHKNVDNPPSLGYREILIVAFRNLSRHRVKTVTTTLGVAVSVALYIFMDAWLLGMNLDSKRNIVSYEIGAAKIQTQAYFEKKDDLPMYESFTDWKPLVEVLEKAGYAAAPRMVFTGTLYARSGSAPIVFHGVDPEKESRVLRYRNYMEVGRFPDKGTYEIALGLLAAEKLKLDIPRRITEEELLRLIEDTARTPEEGAFIRRLYENSDNRQKDLTRDRAPLSQEKLSYFLRKDLPRSDLDRYWELLLSSGRNDVRISTVIDIKEETGKIRHVYQVMEAKVVGIVNSPNPKTNGNVAFMPLDVLSGEEGLLLEDRVTEILVRAAGAKDSDLPGPEETPEAIEGVLNRAGVPLPSPLRVYGWQEYVKDYIVAARGDNITTRVMILLLFILSFLGIANTMLMAILERTKEIGMMRALGMTDGELILSFMIEAGMIGLMGGVAGMILGSLANIPMVNHGIDYSTMARELSGDFGYRITALFRSAWNPGTIIGSGIVATLVSALLSIPPTLRALRIPVTESLRFE
ncbi:MAG: FtsX-like permease family protein [Spirochaetes bacterium]|nr:FtsX-like permease family protein [Spirochaetota bacterium]